MSLAPSLAPLVLSIFPMALLAAAISDVKRYIIPNWTSLLLIAGFLLASLTAALTGRFGLGDFAAQLGMGAGFFALGFTLWACGVWGGGDAKLFAATALWFDPGSAAALVQYVLLIGGGMGVLALVVFRCRFALASVAPVLATIDLEKYAKIAPYGVAIAAGALLALPQSALFQALMG